MPTKPLKIKPYPLCGENWFTMRGQYWGAILKLGPRTFKINSIFSRQIGGLGGAPTCKAKFKTAKAAIARASAIIRRADQRPVKTKGKALRVWN